MRAWVLETSYGRVDAQPELAARPEKLGQHPNEISLGRCSDEEAKPGPEPGGGAYKKYAALR